MFNETLNKNITLNIQRIRHYDPQVWTKTEDNAFFVSALLKTHYIKGQIKAEIKYQNKNQANQIILRDWINDVFEQTMSPQIPLPLHFRN